MFVGSRVAPGELYPCCVALLWAVLDRAELVISNRSVGNRAADVFAAWVVGRRLGTILDSPQQVPTPDFRPIR